VLLAVNSFRLLSVSSGERRFTLLKVLTAVFAASVLTTPVFAGALLLEAADPRTNPEAVAKNAAVVVLMTACHSPEKTTVRATAEGLVAGRRETIPLKIINLSVPGTYAVRRDWPIDGAWTIRVIARNPEYKDYAPGITIPMRDNGFSPDQVKHFVVKPDTLE
jgi:hypothetical protein